MNQVLRGRDGLLHMSEISHNITGPEATAMLSVGQHIDVKCVGVDPLSGAVKLSAKVSQSAESSHFCESAVRQSAH